MWHAMSCREKTHLGLSSWPHRSDSASNDHYLKDHFLMTSVLERALERPLADQFVGRKYLQLVAVLGALMALGVHTNHTYLPALPQLSSELRVNDAHAQLTTTSLLN